MKSLSALVLTLLFSAMLVPAAHAQAPARTAAPPQVRTYYVVLLNLGPNFDPKLPLMSQPNIAQHAAYMGRLTNGGKLLFGGPFVDKPGSMNITSSMLILAAESVDDARKIEEEDPAVATRLMTIAEIKPLLGFAGVWLRDAASRHPAVGGTR